MRLCFHFVLHDILWPGLASLRFFFLDALWRNYLNLVLITFFFLVLSIDSSVFVVMNIVLSLKQMCFFNTAYMNLNAVREVASDGSTILSLAIVQITKEHHIVRTTKFDIIA